MGLSAGNELAGAGIDLDALALVEVHRDLDNGTGIDGRGLVGTLDGIALSARNGLGDLGDDEHRRVYAHELLLGVEQLAGIVLAKPLGVVTHKVGRNGNLLVGLIVHEDVVGAVVVEILHLLGEQLDALELGAGVASLLDYATGLDVLGLVADKSAALAGLDVLELDESRPCP